MTDDDKWDLYMNINRKACDAIKNGDKPSFTITELYEIATMFGGQATILKREIRKKTADNAEDK